MNLQTLNNDTGNDDIHLNYDLNDATNKLNQFEYDDQVSVMDN